eukprot:TRINITY_DN2102_c0_g1_i1.p1 TRINITY_DN2102_c0_g1~~TRINITY_DN2102_c0_g1_i1.p1  ORF type:complete len:230 (+),score=19.84 TRINITY_DN2102_c0_g1_i1:98-787(+)
MGDKDSFEDGLVDGEDEDSREELERESRERERRLRAAGFHYGLHEDGESVEGKEAFELSFVSGLSSGLQWGTALGVADAVEVMVSQVRRKTVTRGRSDLDQATSPPFSAISSEMRNMPSPIVASLDCCNTTKSSSCVRSQGGCMKSEGSPQIDSMESLSTSQLAGAAGAAGANDHSGGTRECVRCQSSSHRKILRTFWQALDSEYSIKPPDAYQLSRLVHTSPSISAHP